MTLDYISYIGQYSKSTPDVFVATGFNKWGMINAMLAANILCDLVRGKSNPYAGVFDPSRTVLRPQLAVNAFDSVVGLLTPTAPSTPGIAIATAHASPRMVNLSTTLQLMTKRCNYTHPNAL